VQATGQNLTTYRRTGLQPNVVHKKEKISEQIPPGPINIKALGFGGKNFAHKTNKTTHLEQVNVKIHEIYMLK
jgi:hypothetical protein